MLKYQNQIPQLSYRHNSYIEKTMRAKSFVKTEVCFHETLLPECFFFT